MKKQNTNQSPLSRGARSDKKEKTSESNGSARFSPEDNNQTKDIKEEIDEHDRGDCDCKDSHACLINTHLLQKRLEDFEKGKLAERKRILEIVNEIFTEQRKKGRGVGDIWEYLLKEIEGEK